MKLLLENWHSYLKENMKGRSLERYATKLTNEVMHVLKDDEFIKNIDKKGHALVTLTSPIIDELDTIRDIFIHVRQDEKYGVAEGDIMTHGSYEYTLGGDEEERKTSDLHINIVLPLEYDFSVFSQLIPELKSTFRHELEHSMQPTEMLDITHEKVPDEEIWKTLERAEDYYTSEAETKAHVVGLYKKAKMLKIPASKVVDEFLGELIETAMVSGYSEEEVEPLIMKIRGWWLHYMKGRYPEAETWSWWDLEDED